MSELLSIEKKGDEDEGKSQKDSKRKSGNKRAQKTCLNKKQDSCNRIGKEVHE